MNTSKQYFQLMRDTKRTIAPIMADINNQILRDFPLLYEDFNILYRKRISSGQLLLRPFLSRLIYGLSNKADWETHKIVFALIEIFNISTYQSNLAFDHKYGIDTLCQTNNQFISSIFSKTLALEKLLQLRNYNSNQLHSLSKLFLESLNDTYYGQFLDGNVLRTDNIIFLNDDNYFYEQYMQRCLYLGGGLLKLCIEIPIILADGLLDDIAIELREFAKSFGTAGQVLNDLGDFSYGGKTYARDRLADINNSKLTLQVRELIINSGKSDITTSDLLAMANDKRHLKQITKITKTFLTRYYEDLFQLISKIETKGYNTDTLKWINNILIKSKYLQIGY